MFFKKKKMETPCVNTTNNKPVKFNSTDFRDGQQSLLATRVRTEDMIPLLEPMDQVGFDSMEMWGGATFDVCLRYLKEDPWERVRTFKKYVKNTFENGFTRTKFGGIQGLCR